MIQVLSYGNEPALQNSTPSQGKSSQFLLEKNTKGSSPKRRQLEMLLSIVYQKQCSFCFFLLVFFSGFAK